MKLIKFDTLYPALYLDKKIKNSLPEIKKMNFREFNSWLIALRMNFSDFYTFNLRQHSWDTEEIFLLSNRYYIRKCGFHYYGYFFYFLMFVYKLKNLIFSKKSILLERLIEKIIKIEKPDVIFIREQSGINSLFWDKFRDKMLVVSRMECGVPKYWSPACFDVVYTNIKTYKDFFESNRIITKNNFSGFDRRILDEINSKNKIYEVVFIGGLGSPTFTEKTDFFESLLVVSNCNFDFKWWGYKEGSNFDNLYPELSKRYMGFIGGLEMFEIYAQSKIVINDYGVAAGGQGMNQRIYEVLGVGTFLLTRASLMFNEWKDSICTFSDVDDCTSKIQYYLTHEEEREKIAKAGQAFVLENFSYFKLIGKLSEELQQAYKSKFSK